jgi:hypothetical protein
MKGDVASLVDPIVLLEQVVIVPLRRLFKKTCAADGRNWIKGDLLCLVLFDN